MLVARIENLFRYTMLVTATVFAWAITQAFGTTPLITPAYGIPPYAAHCLKLPKEIFDLVWLIPPGFVVISGLTALVTHGRVMQMANFLWRCEISLGEPKLSWELFMASKRPSFAIGTVFVWGLMLYATIYSATVGLGLKELPICPW